MGDPVAERREFLRSRLAEVEDRIERARSAVDRHDSVDLLVVTKTFPASDVDLLASLGVRDVGENRDQEARSKRQEVHAGNLRWHMIGRLQRNKATTVARWADVVESVDRLALVQPLADASARSGRESPLEVLIQVSLDPPDLGERGGALPDQVGDIAAAVSSRQELGLAGVMAVAPHPDTGIDPLEAFTALARVARDLQSQWPHATTISAGMSQDLEQAVACGATQVRIGGAILGQRPAVQ